MCSRMAKRYLNIHPKSLLGAKNIVVLQKSAGVKQFILEMFLDLKDKILLCLSSWIFAFSSKWFGNPVEFFYK